MRKTCSSRLKAIMKQRGLRQIDVANLCQPYCRKYGVKMGKDSMCLYVAGKSEPGIDEWPIKGRRLDKQRQGQK